LGPKPVVAFGVLVGFLISAAPAAASFAISSPTLEPEFRGKAPSYVVECDKRVRLSVRSDHRGTVRIGRGRAFTGRREELVGLEPGQAVRVTRKRADKRRSRYYVRCLPDDFPDYTYKRIRPPRVGMFVVTPFTILRSTPTYAVIFDRFGAPVWWFRGKNSAIDAKVLNDGTIALGQYTTGGFATDPMSRYDIREPDGKLKRRLRTVGAITDIHDLQQTADGNYLLLAYKQRANPINTSEFNGDSSADVLDAVAQKVTPKGKLLWEWSSKDHIGLEETGRWWPTLEEPYDLVHINAIEPTISGGDYLISLRHTDGVYRIDGATGDVKWKLGGEPTPQSLEVRKDPFGSYPLGGQHDVRQLEDGTITIHDNATMLDYPTRAVRYRVHSGVARLVEEQADPLAPGSPCCGSARRLSDSWLMSWGGTDLITEFDTAGRRTFKLRIPGQFSYRAIPVERGAITAAALRRGMNQQVPLAK
jgi:Arylsulfotransferase (ASST)